MREKDWRIRTDPWSGVTYRLEVGEKPPPRPVLTDTCRHLLNLHASFEDQRKPGTMARKHIDGCPQCQQYMARREWERRKEEELLSSPDVEALVAEYAKRFRVPFYQRRRVQLIAGLVALILTVVAVILVATMQWGLQGSSSSVTFSPATLSVSPSLIRRDLAAIEARLDQTFASGGASAVSASLVGASTEEILRTFRWVAVRNRTAMIPALVAFLSDSRISVRRGAVGTLLLLPLNAIKPFVSSIRQASAIETDPQLQSEMNTLADLVDRS